MTLKELEKYILSKENAVKTMIAKWNYIRYTVFSSMFASLEQMRKGVVLTVLGRFPQYEKEYGSYVVPALNNDPSYYCSVLLDNEIVPNHVVKSMVDYSYRRRLQSVILPQIAKGRDNIAYCGIMPTLIQLNHTETVGAAEVLATTENDCEVGEYGIKKIFVPPEVEMVGAGQWNNVPYNALSDEKKIHSYIKLKHVTTKKSK